MSPVCKTAHRAASGLASSHPGDDDRGVTLPRALLQTTCRAKSDHSQPGVAKEDRVLPRLETSWGRPGAWTKRLFGWPSRGRPGPCSGGRCVSPRRLVQGVSSPGCDAYEYAACVALTTRTRTWTDCMDARAGTGPLYRASDRVQILPVPATPRPPQLWRAARCRHFLAPANRYLS